MKLEMVAVKDRALNAFMRPFFMQTIGQAIRAFGDEINNKESAMYAHPDDYDLWHLGTWDDASGNIEMEPMQDMQQIAIGKQQKIRE